MIFSMDLCYTRTLYQNPADALRVILSPNIAYAFRSAPCTEMILYPAEQKVYQSLNSEIRRIDFVAGRACAHDALQQLGRADGSVGRGRKGEPLWPQGVVGSITHCTDFWAAAVAPASEFTGLGIDAERTDAMTREVANIVCTPTERHLLESVEEDLYLPLLTLLFSAKESAYKCLYPQQQFLEFHDIDIEILRSPHFQAHISLPKDATPQAFTLPGAYAAVGDLTLTAVCSPTAPTSA